VPRDTTHLSVVDADGNAVSLTHSLAMPSGIITPGMGFLYNGCMGVSIRAQAAPAASSLARAASPRRAPP
jgi:gamma-glutamyltranspeptidase